MEPLREFGIISDISLISFYANQVGIEAFNKIESNGNSNLNQAMKTIILGLCDETDLDEGVNLKKEMDELEKNEPMMYYGIKRYRDHLMHSARIAMLGRWLMGKKMNYSYHHEAEDKCRDCMAKENCQKLEKGRLLEDSVKDMLPGLMVTSITDREKTSIPFNKLNDIYNYNRAFDYHIKKPNDDNLLKKIWLIAAIDHDIGYSFTYIRELFKNNSMLKSDSPYYQNKTHKFDKPHTISAISRELENVFEQLYDIIRTHATSIDTILHNTSLKEIPHGVIGAFCVRNLIEDEYIIELAARAIARHDDDSRQICFHKEPFCFLLVLLDEIQEWGRPLKVLEELGFDEIQSFSMKLHALCDLPYIKYYREHEETRDEFGTFVFELDYTISAEILKLTKFSFPHFFYQKQLNLSRLINGPQVKIRIRIPPLAKQQFRRFRKEIKENYKIAAGWAEKYLKKKGFIDFDLSKSSDPENYFDMRPPNIWPLIKSFKFFKKSKK
jgi:hypothetical protein